MWVAVDVCACVLWCGVDDSIETAPFKLTAEMVEVMGGTDSPLFDEFITLFVCGFFALQVRMVD